MILRTVLAVALGSISRPPRHERVVYLIQMFHHPIKGWSDGALEERKRKELEAGDVSKIWGLHGVYIEMPNGRLGNV